MAHVALSSCLLFALAFSSQLSSITADGDEKKMPTGIELLKKVLFEEYDDALAPEKVDVEFGISFRCAYTEQSPKGSVSVNVWETMVWTDKRLTWDPKKFDGVDELHVHSYSIWIPDIQLYNSLEVTPWNYRNSWNFAIVHSDGTVFWVPQATYTIFCGGNNCHLSLGSWTYSGHQMKLSLYDESGVIMDNYDDNCPIKVSEAEAKIKNTEYDCCPDDPYPSVEVSFSIESEISDEYGGSGDYDMDIALF